jgi:hypothetical protein
MRDTSFELAEGCMTQPHNALHSCRRVQLGTTAIDNDSHVAALYDDASCRHASCGMPRRHVFLDHGPSSLVPPPLLTVSMLFFLILRSIVAEKARERSLVACCELVH